MDLWEITSRYLLANITAGKHFKASHLIDLASYLDVDLKVPRNANSGQINFILQDLLELSKHQFTAMEFITKMSKLEPYETVTQQLKDQIICESIHRMNGTLKIVYDLQKVMPQLNHLLQASGHAKITPSIIIEEAALSDLLPSQERASRQTTKDPPPKRRSVSFSRPTSENRALTPTESVQDSSDIRSMVKQMNISLHDQRKQMAKLSKLCLGALTSIDAIEKNMELNNGTHDSLKHDKPMERIKKISEDSLKLSNQVKELDRHLQRVEEKFREELKKCVPASKMMARLGMQSIFFRRAGNFLLCSFP